MITGGRFFLTAEAAPRRTAPEEVPTGFQDGFQQRIKDGPCHQARSASSEMNGDRDSTHTGDAGQPGFRRWCSGENWTPASWWLTSTTASTPIFPGEEEIWRCRFVRPRSPQSARLVDYLA